jgi:hypothetical protein
MDRRTDEEKLRGVVPVPWAGEIREVPTLKRGPSRVWKDSLAKQLVGIGEVNVTNVDSLVVAGNLAGDTMLALILEYDTGKVLGTPEWIDANVDDSEVYGAFRMLLEVAYPFVNDLRGILAEMRAMVDVAIPSASPVSTNGASAVGASTPKRSTRG